MILILGDLARRFPSGNLSHTFNAQLILRIHINNPILHTDPIPVLIAGAVIGGLANSYFNKNNGHRLIHNLVGGAIGGAASGANIIPGKATPRVVVFGAIAYGVSSTPNSQAIETIDGGNKGAMGSMIEESVPKDPTPGGIPVISAPKNYPRIPILH